MKSKVVMVVDYYPPEVGNRSRRMEEIAKTLVKKGFSVTVVVPDRGLESFVINNSSNGVAVIRVLPFVGGILPSMRYLDVENQSLVFRVFRPFLGYIRWVFPCIKTLRRLNARDAILYTPNNPLSLHFIGFLAKPYFFKWLVELRDPIVNYEVNRFSFWSFIPPLLERLVIRASDRILLRKGIQISASKLKTLYPKYEKKIFELPDYGLTPEDVDRLLNETSNRAVKDENNRDVILGLYAGNYYSNSTPQTIIESVVALNESGVSVALNFYGGWDSGAKKTGKYWRYFGEIPFREIVEKYGKCDFTILLTATEEGTEDLFIPSKLIELIIVGKPILVIGVMGTKVGKFVEENKIGVACESSKNGIMDGVREVISMIENEGYDNSLRADIVKEAKENSYLNNFVKHTIELTSE